MEEDEVEDKDELEEEEEDMYDKYGSDGDETMDDEYASEVEAEVMPQSIPSPPPQSTWNSPEMGQSRKTDESVSSYNDTPGNGDTVSLQGSNADSLMFSPDSVYSPVNSPGQSAPNIDDKSGSLRQNNVKDMPAMTSSQAGNPEEDVTSSMDHSTMDESTLTSLSRPIRKRHKGAASKRLLQAKQAEERFGSTKKNGWVNSIRVAASTQGKVWDPILGWVDYSEPEVHGVVDHDYSSIGNLHLRLPHKSVTMKGDYDNAGDLRMTADSSFATSIADENDTVFDSMTGNTVNTAAEAYSVSGTSLSAPRYRAAPRHRATDRRKIASTQQVNKPVGWKESMENATAHVANYDGTDRYWDYEKGWVRADGTVDDDVSVLTRSVLESDQLNQGDSVMNNGDDISAIAAAEESVPLVQNQPVVGTSEASSAEDANMKNSTGIEHFDDFSDGGPKGANNAVNINVNMADTIQPQGSDKENQESEEQVSSASPQLSNINSNKQSLNQWFENATKNAHPKQDNSEDYAIVSDDTRTSNTSDNLLMYDNNSITRKSLPHYSNIPDSFGEIERGVQEVKVIKEKFSDADSDLFEPTKVGVSQSFVNIINRANVKPTPNSSAISLQTTEQLVLHKTESHDSNNTGLPPPPPPRPHHSSYTEYQTRPRVLSVKSPEDKSDAGRFESRSSNSMDTRNCRQQLPLVGEKSLASELDSNAPQVSTAGGLISSSSNAPPSQKRSDPTPNLDPPSTSTGITVSTYIGTRNAKRASDSWIQSRKDTEKDEMEEDKIQAPPSNKPFENTGLRSIAVHQSKFDSSGMKLAPIFVPTKNSTLENQVFFRSTAMGIRLKRGEDGFVRVVSVTEATAGSSIVRDGAIEPEDMVLEAAGVDLRKPITNSQWGETVTKIRNATRPMVFTVAAGPKRRDEKKPEYPQTQSSIHPPPAKFVLESRLSKSPEGQEVLESLSVARSYERVLESLSKTQSRSPVFVPPSAKNTKNTSSQTSIDADQTVSTQTVDNGTVSAEDQTASRSDYVPETHQIPRKESLLKRMTTGCVSPVAACAVPANQSSQQSSSISSSDDEGHVPMAHLQFLRTNPTIARVTNAASRRYPALCGRPDTIFEEPSDDDTRETRNSKMKEMPLRRDIWLSSSRSTASTNDDGSRTMTTATTYTKTVGSTTANGSMVSSGGGDNTAFLEKLAIQSSVAIKPTRPQRGEGNNAIISQMQKLNKVTSGVSRHLITGTQIQQQDGNLEWPENDDEQQRPQLSSEGAIYEASTSYSNRKKTQTARQAENLAAAKVEDMMNELQDVDPDDQCEI
ncbi:hypothetical protein ACHAXA_005816 [Cyclostephanos tholiformis]|uniref:PDZ domain-containing protein n=1 Tax=Cyclostephanos tholiformis TaxID=382380 RepID=A0ABD3S054_9STRA